MSGPAPSHYQNMARLIRDGVLIPFLGAGVNSCGGPRAPFQVGERLPSGEELSLHLANTCGYTGSTPKDLARVAQYVAMTLGDADLYRELHRVFDHDVAPTPLHHLLARLPAIAREQEKPSFPVIVTTNYDDALERAFDMAGESYDTVIYLSHGRDRGRVLHRRPDGEIDVVRTPNRYTAVSVEERPVIVKIHGAVDRRSNFTDDSYVITEDHYIEYLTHTDVAKLLPVRIASTIRLSHFLFLGYSLRDWNLRVILHRLWGEQSLDHVSWAVQLQPDSVEAKFWARRNVEILDHDLNAYVADLRGALGLEQVLAS